jgi:hypothetical protein
MKTDDSLAICAARYISVTIERSMEPNGCRMEADRIAG